MPLDIPPNRLGEWFNLYGRDYWNGECYHVDQDNNLYPIQKEIAEDEWEIVGYTFSSFHHLIPMDGGNLHD